MQTQGWSWRLKQEYIDLEEGTIKREAALGKLISLQEERETIEAELKLNVAARLRRTRKEDAGRQGEKDGRIRERERESEKESRLGLYWHHGV